MYYVHLIVNSIKSLYFTELLENSPSPNVKANYGIFKGGWRMKSGCVIFANISYYSLISICICPISIV